jgi:hypothetical protein
LPEDQLLHVFQVNIAHPGSGGLPNRRDDRRGDFLRMIDVKGDVYGVR